MLRLLRWQLFLVTRTQVLFSDIIVKAVCSLQMPLIKLELHFYLARGTSPKQRSNAVYRNFLRYAEDKAGVSDFRTLRLLLDTSRVTMWRAVTSSEGHP